MIIKLLDKIAPKLDLDTQITIAIIASFATGIISYLSIFGLAGRFGGIVGSFILLLFGRGAFFIPLCFFGSGFILIRLQQNRQLSEDVNSRMWWGIFLLTLSFSGFLSLSFGVRSIDQVTDGGGVLGYLIYPLFLGEIFGAVGGGFLLFCIFLIGFFLVSQMTFTSFLDKIKGLVSNPSGFWDLVPDLFEFWKADGKATKSKATNSQKKPEIEENIDTKNNPESSKEATKLYQKITQDLNKEILVKQATDKTQEKTTTKPQEPKSKTTKWQLPAFDLLSKGKKKPVSGDLEANKKTIQETLKSFGIEVEMKEVYVGPTVTQYTLKPASGVRLSAIDGLQRDIALALAAPNIRIQAPISGKSLVGIEAPNKDKADVRLRDIIQTNEFKYFEHDLPVAIGKDVSGENVIYGISKMPHLLVAGATGSGKSVFINGLLLSLLYNYSPENLGLILVDMKRVELKLYDGTPHLLSEVITDSEKAINSLKWALVEMDKRYKLLEKYGKRNIVDYNKFSLGLEEVSSLPYIVFVMDELGDLMMLAKNEVEPIIVRLTQMSRAVGIHLVLGTQRPDTNVVTGLIKANVPTRIGFAVASQVDSRVILDVGGAEKLLGQGDGLMISPSKLHPIRFQGSFVSEDEVRKCVQFLKQQTESLGFDSNLTKDLDQKQEINKSEVPGFKPLKTSANNGNLSDDDYYQKAKDLICMHQKASTSFLQQMLGIGYPKAGKLMIKLEENGFIGPANGSKPREVYVTPKEI
jgi:S-DNA-T family DNA segregation ATPase FtsK/SpoIIIE